MSEEEMEVDPQAEEQPDQSTDKDSTLTPVSLNFELLSEIF